MKRKLIMNLQLFGLGQFSRPFLNADNGAGNGGEGNPPANEGAPKGEDGNPTGEEPKTFTQDELDAIVKDKIAKAKKGQPSKEELEEFKQWKESQKTEEEKRTEALNNAEQARLAAEEKATALEAKVTCLTKGVTANSVDDVVILAKAMVNDELTMDQAIDKVLEKYPSFKGEQQKQEQNQNGFIIGANNTKQKVNPNDAIARAFGIK